MSFLKSLKISDPEKLKDPDFVSSLNEKEVISKLLLAVFSLQGQVEKLNAKLEKYENLDKLLNGEDLSEPPVPDPKKESLIVEKVSKTPSDDSIPVGFTPLYSTPALSESEIIDKPAKKNVVVKPWPEVSLNQLAQKFKVPREQLMLANKTLNRDRKGHLRSLKPNVETETLSPSDSKESTPQPTKLTKPAKRKYDQTIDSPSSNEANSSGSSDPSSETTPAITKKPLKYTITSLGLYKCDVCSNDEIYSSYPALYEHKKSTHPDELTSIKLEKSS
ncbi:hypothetical protein KL921_003561 [Ogataea angusta]|uniref:Uncharacterized protein n=1 Tax=Pichia angusta TaxID=870730 RepID=A0AAN6I526_PICAN|nr:uncharacterized protein KL928_003798 [Ogataea angusta]KAG7809564.1 hypothetical protein KL921_003561 [Ogataea angusta]KAG7817009.1 hypothetical protein KL909_005360 [Ogataea angusta]KAG7817899.1 hypothetical protein KL928_003798 [Ogataea angusta]KAG7826711.1 hypothetical protein KL920_005313 [Ogataea angusta]KAG7833494.1 hypothetical protein KL943_003602 [Ogataea angusta]